MITIEAAGAILIIAATTIIIRSARADARHRTDMYRWVTTPALTRTPPPAGTPPASVAWAVAWNTRAQATPTPAAPPAPANTGETADNPPIHEVA